MIQEMSKSIELVSFVKNRVCTPCESKECNCSEHSGLEHILSGDCEHQVVAHGDHLDVVINGQLHHPHNEHYDYHGIYDPNLHKQMTPFTQYFRSMMYILLFIFELVVSMTIQNHKM